MYEILIIKKQNVRSHRSILKKLWVQEVFFFPMRNERGANEKRVLRERDSATARVQSVGEASSRSFREVIEFLGCVLVPIGLHRRGGGEGEAARRASQRKRSREERKKRLAGTVCSRDERSPTLGGFCIRSYGREAPFSPVLYARSFYVFTYPPTASPRSNTSHELSRIPIIPVRIRACTRTSIRCTKHARATEPAGLSGRPARFYADIYIPTIGTYAQTRKYNTVTRIAKWAMCSYTGRWESKGRILTLFLRSAKRPTPVCFSGFIYGGVSCIHVICRWTYIYGFMYSLHVYSDERMPRYPDRKYTYLCARTPLGRARARPISLGLTGSLVRCYADI